MSKTKFSERDPLALEWQALDKELQQFVDARRAILATGTEQEVGS